MFIGKNIKRYKFQALR